MPEGEVSTSLSSMSVHQQLNGAAGVTSGASGHCTSCRPTRAKVPYLTAPSGFCLISYNLLFLPLINPSRLWTFSSLKARREALYTQAASFMLRTISDGGVLGMPLQKKGMFEGSSSI